jgi:hypothetical protein
MQICCVSIGSAVSIPNISLVCDSIRAGFGYSHWCLLREFPRPAVGENQERITGRDWHLQGKARGPTGDVTFK